MVAVKAPAPGDMEGLEKLLDLINPKLAKLFTGVPLLDRVEVGRRKAGGDWHAQTGGGQTDS